MRFSLLLALLLLRGALACCSLAPAEFHGTRGLAAETRVRGQVLHVLGYQNTAKNKAAGANAMLLPIPASKGSMGPSNMLDISACPHALEDIDNAVARSNVSRGPVSEGRGAPVQVFDHGLYTVVLAQDANDIPSALSRVAADRRPEMAPAIFNAYSKWYPGWTFALCCFNSRQSAQGDPMVWWYEPLDREHLFFPGLDAHTGAPPDLHSQVEVEHSLAVSAIHMSKGVPVDYREPLTRQQMYYLPQQVLGQKLSGTMANGDFVFDLEEVRAGKVSARRVLPPGAAPKN